MSLETPPTPEFSGQQRRCQSLLLLYTTPHSLQLATFSQLNNVDPAQSLQDIADVREDIQRNYRLQIVETPDGGYRLLGCSLDKRLCLIHWLRRGLRLCPSFIQHSFAPALQTAIQGTPTTFDSRLADTVSYCEQLQQRIFSDRERVFLQVYLLYCLWENQRRQHPQFSVVQQRWLQQKEEQRYAAALFHHLQSLSQPPLDHREQPFLTLLLTLLKPHGYRGTLSVADRRLFATVDRMIQRFQQLAILPFSDQEEMTLRLFAHLEQMLERSLFAIGIDSPLQDELQRKYPRLLEATQSCIEILEWEYQIKLSVEERGPIAIIFGAWLGQEGGLQEKQLLLLTQDDRQQEAYLEQQIRQLTLLPISIKYLSLQDFHRQGVPPGIALVVSPYLPHTASHTLPLFHIPGRLDEQQRQQLVQLLEAF